jgi:spore maturation protein CgeB
MSLKPIPQGQCRQVRRIFYVGGLRLGATGRERAVAMQALGFEVHTFDLDPYLNGSNRLAMSFTWRTAWGPLVWRLNQELRQAATVQDYDLVWISKGVWIFKETVELLKKGGRAKVVHYTPDSAINVKANRTRHFMRCVPHYDAHITSKAWEVTKYLEVGAKKVLCIPQGVNTELFKPPVKRVRRNDMSSSDVCFVGRFEAHYAEVIQAVRTLQVDLAVWGDQWWRLRHKHPWLNSVVRGPGVFHSDYVRVLAGAKIGLGLLSKAVGDTATTRSIEIPACGTFLLAERTEEHQMFFEEGIEAEFFGCAEEMLEKIQYYQKHDRARERIASAGYRAVSDKGYDNLSRMKETFDQLLG